MLLVIGISLTSIKFPMLEQFVLGNIDSIKYNSLLSWNEIQSLLMPTKLDDLKDIKTGLRKCLLASY